MILILFQKSTKVEGSMVAVFNRQGDKIFTGDTKGNINIIDVETLQV